MRKQFKIYVFNILQLVLLDTLVYNFEHELFIINFLKFSTQVNYKFRNYKII